MQIIKDIIELVLPENFDLAQYCMNLLIAIISVLVVGGIFRLCFGKGSVLNSAISSAIAILCLYTINVLIYSLGDNFEFLFTPLPFISVSNDTLYIFPIFESTFAEICAEIVTMMVLTFLMNLFEGWLPQGKKVWSWFFFRFLSLSIAICVHYCLNVFLRLICQDNALTIIPLVLLGIVVVAFLLGCLKMLAGDALSMIDPFLSLFHSFFFKQDTGKHLMRAILSTILLTILVVVLNYLSYTAISITSAAVMAYLPIIFFGLVLWYVIAQFL